MSGRPVAAIQSGDAFENRMRALPVALAFRDAGWEPVLLIDDIGAASPFLLHGLSCVALRRARAPAGYDPGFAAAPDELCPLDAARRAEAGEALADAEYDKALVTARDVWRALDLLRPAAVVAWNGHTGAWANALRLYKAAHGLPGGFMERGPYPDATFFDPEGVNGFASFAGAPVASEPGVGPAVPPPVSRRKTILVPLQVRDDSNVMLHAPRIRRMRDLALFALAAAERLGADWNVVARPHPEELPSARLNLPLHPRLTVDGAAALADQIAAASVCVTINSMAGLEAALAGRVTACLGEGIYCRQTFVVEAQEADAETAADRLRRRLESGAAPSAEASRFIGWLERRNLFRAAEDPETRRDKLLRMGLDPSRAAPPSGSPLGVTAAGARWRRAAGRLSASSSGGSGEVLLDFDFVASDTLFRTYRDNRSPITREHLEARAAETLKRPVTLSPAHRALGARGDVLITHSRRRPRNIGRYRLVLDEWGLPHARTYLRTIWPF